MNEGPIRPSPEEEGGFRGIFDAAADGLIITDLESGLVVEANAEACAMHGYAYQEFIGLLPAAYIHPDSQHQFRNFRALRSGAVMDSRMLHLRRDGSTFHANWRGTTFIYQGRPCLLGVVRDVSRRVQTDQLLQECVEARTREQSALLEISHAMASTLELQPGLILEQIQGIIEYEHAGFFKLMGSTLTTLAFRGPQELEQAAASQFRLEDHEALVTLFNGHRAVRIADVSSPDPAAELLRSLLGGEAAGLLQGVRAWMWVPMAVKDRILGGLAGAGAMLLFAPQSGKRTRAQVRHNSIQLRDRTTDAVKSALAQIRVDAHEITADVRNKAGQLKQLGQEKIVKQLDRVSAALDAGKTAVKDARASMIRIALGNRQSSLNPALGLSIT